MPDKLLYEHVHAELKGRIAGGRYPVGQRLPSPADLCEEFSVSTITVKRALDMLAADGYVVRRPRRGTVVVSAEPEQRRGARGANGTIGAMDTAVWAGGAAGGGNGATLPLFGAVLTSFDDTFGGGILTSMLAETAARANLIVKMSFGDADAEEALIGELLAAGVAGLAFQPSSSESVPPALLGLLARRFPVVIIDRSFDGIPVSAVCSDNVAGGRAATEHLLDLGHRRIGLVTSASRVSTVQDRRNGYVRAHAARGVPHDDADEFHAVDSVTPGATTSPEQDLARLTEFVRSRPEITAYLASEHHIALLLRKACQAVARTVPGDVSIVCFDQAEALVDDSVFGFTHIAQAQHLMGTRVIEELFAQLADPGAVTKHALPTRLVPGASTAARH
ncbi:GntR family transcriptional regulator [Catenulispora sp. NL8]|uniref:GntR family transcriptional regulator n=1 Tax=Catenulispora pinistramenti TaxID=2705254 RepID=A0ABS5KVT0_9ACTN|nr:GntR family transcriptional regulator [Catenulispora pinistramenti]MBS2550176.1 GntR family transcriptional regulator [Catenulispora pinistramenti]